MPIGSGVTHTGDPESGAEEDPAATAARLKRQAASRESSRRWRQKRKIAASLAGMAAAPSTMCVVDADGSRVAGNTEPSTSVHTCGATIVRGIVTKDHFKVCIACCSPIARHL